SEILQEYNGEDQDRDGDYFYSWIPRMQGRFKMGELVNLW
ncbi:unnamed protein product, partial [marine sediment metagenome]